MVKDFKFVLYCVALNGASNLITNVRICLRCLSETRFCFSG